MENNVKDGELKVHCVMGEWGNREMKVLKWMNFINYWYFWRICILASTSFQSTLFCNQGKVTKEKERNGDLISHFSPSSYIVVTVYCCCWSSDGLHREECKGHCRWRCCRGWCSKTVQPLSRPFQRQWTRADTKPLIFSLYYCQASTPYPHTVSNYTLQCVNCRTYWMTFMVMAGGLMKWMAALCMGTGTFWCWRWR